MKIAIVEDEKKWQHIVKREVESYKTNIKIDIFSTGEEFLEEKEVTRLYLWILNYLEKMVSQFLKNIQNR